MKKQNDFWFNFGIVAFFLLIIVPYYLISFQLREINGYISEIKREKAVFDAPYEPILELNKTCWVRALDTLNEIRKDKDIKNPSMILGKAQNTGHAWIRYEKNGKVYNYDPAFGKFINIDETK